MKRLQILYITAFTIISTLFFGYSVNAQQVNPVKWSFSAEKISKNEFNLIMSGQIENGWHLYTIDMEEGGPMPMFIDFEASDDYSLEGKITEKPKPVAEHDEVFDIDVKYHVAKVVYKQKIKTNTDKKFTVKAVIDGQACSQRQKRNKHF